MANQIQVKRGAEASLPTLASGEFGWCTDTTKLHMGTGSGNEEVLMHNEFDANTILAANSDNTPAALTVSTNTVVGRLAGNITDISMGIANDNVVQMDDADATDNDYAKFTANGLEGRSYTEVKQDLNLEIGTDVLAQQAIGIGDDNLLEVDQVGGAADNDYAKFTANGLEGRSYTEVKQDLNLEIGTDVLAQQTIGIADDNLLEVDGTPNSGEYARFTANGLEGRTESEFKADFNLQIGTDVLAQQTIGIANNNLLEVDGNPNDNEFAKFTANGLEGRTYAETLSDLSGQATAAFDFNSQTVTVGTPSAGGHATTKTYVDNLVSAGVSWCAAVLDKDQLGPPGGESTGDRYWIGGTGTGAWSGHDYEIAEYNGSGWDYTPAVDGMAAYVTDEDQVYFYDADSVDEGLYVMLGPQGDHAGRHIDGGDDPIDGDKIEITWSGMSNYTRNTSPSEVDQVDQLTAHLKGIDTALAAATGVDEFVELTDVDEPNYTGHAGELVVVNSTPDGLQFATFSTYLESSPSNGESNKAPDSNWAYDHNNAATNVHGAGGNTLLHSGSTIDGGSFT